MKYYSIGQFSKKVGKHIDTLRNWDKNGKLKPAYVAESGFRYYTEEQINEVLHIKAQTIERKIIGYCRVNTPKQKADLEKQIENVKMYMYAKGYCFEIITDIGSGSNYKNKGLNQMLEKVMNNEVEKIVVLKKDRLLSYGFELMETICNKYNTKIEVIDNTEKVEEKELIEDLIQIVNIFSCKLPDDKVKKTRAVILSLQEI